MAAVMDPDRLDRLIDNLGRIEIFIAGMTIGALIALALVLR
jgi:hypothetical protein